MLSRGTSARTVEFRSEPSRAVLGTAQLRDGRLEATTPGIQQMIDGKMLVLDLDAEQAFRYFSDWSNGYITSKRTALRNPWADVPPSGAAQYVHSEDRPYVDAFNAVPGRRREHVLRTDLVPEPFTGPRDAAVVVLFLNPGVGGEEEQWHRRAEFTAAVRATWSDDPAGHRHLGLDDRFADTGGGRWTRRTFRAVREAIGCGFDDLADRVLSVEFHGYHSKAWTPLPVTLPSQRFGFALVEDAVDRGAVVVAMRGRPSWTVAVPSLGPYPGLLPPPRNPRQSALSPGNLGRDAFDRLVAALRT